MSDKAIIITQLVTLATVVIGFVVALYRERRNRQWDLEDREHARRELLVKQDDTNIKLDNIKDKMDETTTRKPGEERRIAPQHRD